MRSHGTLQLRTPRADSGAALLQASADFGSSPLKMTVLYPAKPMAFG